MTENALAEVSAEPVNGDIDFGLLPDLIGYHLRRSELFVFQGFAKLIAPLQVTPGQFGVLTLVQANSGLSQSSLAKAVGIERSTMVAVIDRLESQGLIERQPSSVDRRSYALRLTPKGEATIERLKALVLEHEARTFGEFSERDRRTLVELLKRIGPRD